MNDFKLYLKELGITENDLIEWMRLMDKKHLMEVKSDKYYKKKSNIQGIGLFATNKLSKGEYIGFALFEKKRTTLARYTNHSGNPNIKFIKSKNNIIGIANQTIKKDEELLVNYRHENL
jgi:SET domain-containing protein